MVRCDKCETDIPYLPFQCKYCGKYFCRDHRLPENHGCTGRYNAPVVVVPTKVQKEMGITIEERAPKYHRKRLYQDADATGRTLRRREPWFSSPRWRRLQESKFGRYPITYTFLILFLIGYILTLTPTADYVVLNPPFFFFQYYFHTLATAVWVPAIGLGPFGMNIFLVGLILFMFYQFGRQLERGNGSKFLFKFVFICGLLTGAVFVLATLLFSLIPTYGIILYLPFGVGTTFGIIIGYLVYVAYFAPQQSFRLMFIPFQIKAKTIAIVFIAISIGWGFLIWSSDGFLPADSLSMCNGLQDLGGALGGYLIARYGRGRLPTPPPRMQFISQY